MILVMKVLVLVNKRRHLQTAANTAHLKMGSVLFLGGVCFCPLTTEKARTISLVYMCKSETDKVWGHVFQHVFLHIPYEGKTG